MPNNLLKPAVFSLGLLALIAVGAGYVGSNPLALAVVLLITACYVAGALELRRYGRATTALATSVDSLDAPVDSLAAWLASVPASLRATVRQRIEGELTPLPAPALTPYLVGLLVLLGMLGTLLGMMSTLRGTGMALESATDLDAVRTSLAAPVKGLAFAFGTSIAGVAASAMLGLLSALCRRERSEAAQALDAAIATHLHVHSRSHQREEAFRLLQRQVDTMPTLVEQLASTMAAIERQSALAHERQLAQQAAFHARAEATHAQLAVSVGQSLEASVARSAEAAGATLRPVAEDTMAALTKQAAGLHAEIAQAMQRQIESIGDGLQASTDKVATLWTDAIAQQRAANEAVAQQLDGTLARITGAFEQRATQLVDTISARVEEAGTGAVAAWNDALSRQAALGEALARNNEQALSQATTKFGEALSQQAATSEALASGSAQALADARAAFEAALSKQLVLGEALARNNEQALAEATTKFTEAVSQQAAVGNSLASGSAQALTDARTAFEEALSKQLALGEALARNNEQALAAATAGFEAQAASLVDTVQRSHAELQARLEANTQAHARETLAEISRLVHDAAEAPKAAAAVIAELRQNLSDSLARDTAMLEERGRLLATVDTLLGAVNHASAEQRAAVDALIQSSADAMERVAARFTGQVEAQGGRLDDAADRIAAGAIDVASVGDVFSEAVQRFGDANEQLAARLQAIEGALERSLERSDEQLAYYVAQAREVVDLSLLAQKQILGELQQRTDAQAQPA
ncbi:MAG TPA: DUF802 domain-containing protein [Lysobacter sp.]